MLPARWFPTWYKFRPYGRVVILLLVFGFSALDKLLNPLQDRLFDWVFR